jgi:putative tryptophan/tyrosine transport system substrate-binding protein
VQFQYLEIRDPKDTEPVLRAAKKGQANGAVVLNCPLHPARYSGFCGKVPVIVDEKGLMSYGTSLNDLDRRSATYVDKILKCAKPAELPVEQPKKFELIIDLKAAKQIDLTTPPNVLARADKVIR